MTVGPAVEPPALINPPISSPYPFVNSTRRFCARPLSVSFGATGFVAPKPTVFNAHLPPLGIPPSARPWRASSRATYNMAS
jgi:hypothetical protein